MKEHVTKCKKYREAYKEKLSAKKLSDSLKEKLRVYEIDLDEVNIRIQRQLAEREVKKKIEDDKKAEITTAAAGGGGFFGWLWGAKKSASTDGAGENDVTVTVKKLEEAMTAEEKQQLYDALGYQVQWDPNNLLALVWYSDHSLFKW